MANWIAGAIKHPGSLRKELHVPAGEKIPAKKLSKAMHSSNPTERRRAILARTLSRFHHGKGGPSHKEGSAYEESHESKAEAEKEGDYKPGFSSKYNHLNK